MSIHITMIKTYYLISHSTIYNTYNKVGSTLAANIVMQELFTGTHHGRVNKRLLQLLITICNKRRTSNLYSTL